MPPISVERKPQPLGSSGTLTNPDNLPLELKQDRAWVGASHDKIPLDARILCGASSTNPRTWNDFETAKRALGKTAIVKINGKREQRQVEGLGYVLRHESQVWCLDLDDVVAPDRSIDHRTQELIDRFASYSEVSQSGKGIHIFALSEVDESLPDRTKFWWHGLRVEFYSHSRFILMTGDRCNAAPLRVVDDELPEFLEELEKSPNPFSPVSSAPGASVGAPGASGTSRLSDDEILMEASISRSGEKFQRLMRGDCSDYTNAQGEPDHSSADFALCGMLAFWTANDTAQLDRIFRRSGLLRPKWDAKRGDSTYGARTIQRALRAPGDVYHRQIKEAQTSGGGSKPSPAGSNGSDQPSEGSCSCSRDGGEGAGCRLCTKSSSEGVNTLVQRRHAYEREMRKGLKGKKLTPCWQETGGADAGILVKTGRLVVKQKVCGNLLCPWCGGWQRSLHERAALEAFEKEKTIFRQEIPEGRWQANLRQLQRRNRARSLEGKPPIRWWKVKTKERAGHAEVFSTAPLPFVDSLEEIPPGERQEAVQETLLRLRQRAKARERLISSSRGWIRPVHEKLEKSEDFIPLGRVLSNDVSKLRLSWEDGLDHPVEVAVAIAEKLGLEAKTTRSKRVFQAVVKLPENWEDHDLDHWRAAFHITSYERLAELRSLDRELAGLRRRVAS